VGRAASIRCSGSGHRHCSNRLGCGGPAGSCRRPFLRVIGVLPDQLVTEQRILPPLYEGRWLLYPGRDLLKLAVIERHRASGALGVGFIQGIGLRRGALAGTVAHDHHNLIVVGADDRSMLASARAVAEMGRSGGSGGEEILARLPLPVAGLMSDRPVEEVRRRLCGCGRRGSRAWVAAARPADGDEFYGVRGDPCPQTDRPGAGRCRADSNSCRFLFRKGRLGPGRAEADRSQAVASNGGGGAGRLFALPRGCAARSSSVRCFSGASSRRCLFRGAGGPRCICCPSRR
jgi:hypothetical protein